MIEIYFQILFHLGSSTNLWCYLLNRCFVLNHFVIESFHLLETSDYEVPAKVPSNRTFDPGQLPKKKYQKAGFFSVTYKDE